MRDASLVVRTASPVEGLAVFRGSLFLNVDTCNAGIVSKAVRLTGVEIDATTVGGSIATSYVLAFAAIVVHLCIEPSGGQTGCTICIGRRARGKHDHAETGEYSGDKLHRSYRVKREFLGFVMC